MVGQLLPGSRVLQVFCSTDRASGTRSYSRNCTVEQGFFMMVRVPLRAGKEVRSGLSDAERRFLEENITPAEHRARGNGGRRADG